MAIGRWKSDKQARHVREHYIDSFEHIFLSTILHACIVPGN